MNEDSKWYSLSTEELRTLVDSPKNSGIRGSLMTFIIVMVNVIPVFLEAPVAFTKAYFNSVFTNFIKN